MRLSAILAVAACSLALAAPHGLDDRSALAQPEPAAVELPRAGYVRQPEPEPESPESDGHFVKKKRVPGRTGTEYQKRDPGRTGTGYQKQKKRAPGRNGTEYQKQKREGDDAVENGVEKRYSDESK